MTLFDYYLQYMTEVWEGKRPAPEGITLPDSGDESTRIGYVKAVDVFGRVNC